MAVLLDRACSSIVEGAALASIDPCQKATDLSEGRMAAACDRPDVDRRPGEGPSGLIDQYQSRGRAARLCFNPRREPNGKERRPPGPQNLREGTAQAAGGTMPLAGLGEVEGRAHHHHPRRPR